MDNFFSDNDFYNKFLRPHPFQNWNFKISYTGKIGV